MKSKMQRDAFLDGEGDQYFYRNKIEKNNIDNLDENYSDHLTDICSNLPLDNSPKINVLEIGCGQALRLKELNKIKGWTVHGVDPSKKAVQYAQENGVNSKVSTADKLPYEDNKFDLVIFGFCLYVCDREDLFKIAYEADRVLKKESWLIIFDFWAPSHDKNNYHHLKGIKSYKMDLPKMFSWHPSYIVFDHAVRLHGEKKYTDNPKEWVASTLIRKNFSFYK